MPEHAEAADRAPPEVAMPEHTEAEQVLLGLAWLGELRTDQVRRLWLPAHHPRTAQRLLAELRGEGYVQRRLWARWLPGRATPARLPALWALTARGRELVRPHPQFPPEYKPPRSRRMAWHDATAAEAVVRLVELARALRPPGALSGLYVEREVRLDPDRLRPLMDALVVVTLGDAPAPPHLVPWARAAALAGERRVRYALENDRATEPLAVIAAKAAAYAAAGTPAWVARYGAFPLPLWVAPSVARLAAIGRTWRRAWPAGKWLLTCDAWLAHDYWLEHDGGAVRPRGLFYTTPGARPPGTPADEQRLARLLDGMDE